MARVYSGQRTFLHPVLAPVERLFYRAAAVKPDAEMTWKTYAVAMLVFNLLGLLAVYALQRLQGILPLNPQGLARGGAGLVLQHRGQLRHQHQLAGLRRRNDDELPHADAGADRAELRLGGHGHGRADRSDARDRPPHGADDRQFLG